MLTYTWKLNPQPNGQYTRSEWIAGPNGREEVVMSVDEDGNHQTRPKGTVGPWELCDLAGAALRFRPNPNGPIYVFFPEA